MVADSSLQQSVLDELNWEPRVNAAHIGVSAKDGVVTLSGDVDSYAEKWAAERAARRVYGVKAVAENMTVRFPSDKPDDTEIAQKALRALSWDVEVPSDKVKVEVENGWITLAGAVDWHFQREAAEGDVRKLKGVAGVFNNITITPNVQVSDLREKIKAALKRNAAIEANTISVTAEGGKVTLSGTVDSWDEDRIVRNSVWSAPGVTQVEDKLIVG